MLQHLATLAGLPDLREARWICGSAANSRSPFYHNRYSLDGVARPLFFDYANYGWRLSAKTPGDVPRVLCLGTIEPVPYTTLYDEWRDLSAEEKAENKKALANYINEIPPAIFVDTLIRQFPKVNSAIQQKKARGWSTESFEQERDMATGAILLVAAQICRHGDTALANKLTGALFQEFPDQEKAVNEATSLVATMQYHSATDALIASGDWRAYEKSLRALLEKYPRHWHIRPAVELLLPRVRQRLSTPAPAIHTSEAAPLSPVAVTVFHALGQLKTPREIPSRHINNLWVFETHPIAQQHGWHDFGGAWEFYDMRALLHYEVLLPLQALGVNAIPVLAALLDDTFLTPIPSNRANSISIFFNTPAAGATTPAQKQAVYENIYRPLTRGEIAKTLLLPLLPGNTYDKGRLSTAALTKEALAFWEEAHTKSPVQLAQLYLNQNFSPQKEAAAQFLCLSPLPDAGSAFEKALLESDNPELFAEAAVEYLISRSGTAGEFGKKYALRLRGELLLDDPANPRSEDNSRGHPDYNTVRHGTAYLEEKIQTILTLSETRPLQDAIRSLVQLSPERLPAAISGIEPMLDSTTNPNAVLPHLLEAAAATRDPALRGYLLVRMNLAKFFAEHPGGYANSNNIVYRYDLPASDSSAAKQWEALFNDTGPIWQGAMNYPFATPTQGAYAAAIFLELTGTTRFPDYLSTCLDHPFADRELGELLIRRAKAQLRGETPPLFPDPASVSNERLEEIIDGIARTAPLHAMPTCKISLPRNASLGMLGRRSRTERAQKIPPLRKTVLPGHRWHLPRPTGNSSDSSPHHPSCRRKSPIRKRSSPTSGSLPAPRWTRRSSKTSAHFSPKTPPLTPAPSSPSSVRHKASATRFMPRNGNS